jgi:cyclic 2,3-diphosphoglycerate synthetase
VLSSYLSEEYGADVTHVSGNLADRDALREELERVDAEVFLVELKAAAVDVVAEHALARGAEVILAANDVIPLPGEVALDEMLLEMAGITV